ncbi:MAG: nucleotide sugar dehydrogenase [Candidatus Aminicenantia bacterium]
MLAKDLLNKIRSKQALIGIIGLGYVGLPLVIRFGEENFKVIGFDIDEKKVEKLNRGKSYIKHIQSEKIKQLINKNKFQATSDYSRLKEVECILICVPTPLNSKREPDLSCIENTSNEIAKNLKKGHLVSLESTTYPGTTREILLPKFENNGLKVGKDFFLIFSPEREDPGNPKYNTKNIPKVVGGITTECTEAGKSLYEQIVDQVVTVPSPEVAEFTKLLENIFRAVNIALVNELKMLADKMGVDIWEIIEAASTKPFGFMPFYPGPGLGGHCTPIDPFYLSWKAKELNFNTHFIELAGEVNTNMPNYVVSKITDALNEKGKSLKNSKILILGIAYKKDIDDIRESPGVEIIDILKSKGAKVDYNDPYIPSFSGMRHYPNLAMKSVKLTEEKLKEYDCMIITTDHSNYDYEWIVKNSKLVIDTRNATKNIKIHQRKIRKA